jgi:hypothetical protein
MSSKIEWGNIILRVPIKLEYETPTGLIREGPTITAKANLSTRNKKKSITIIADDDIKTPSVSVLKNELKGKRKDNEKFIKIRDTLKNDIKKLKDDNLINKEEFKDLNDFLKSGLDLYKKNNDDAELKLILNKLNYIKGITYVFGKTDNDILDKTKYRNDKIENILSGIYDRYKVITSAFKELPKTETIKKKEVKVKQPKKKQLKEEQPKKEQLKEEQPKKKEETKTEKPKEEQPKKEEVKEDKNNEILKKLQDDREIFYNNINRFLQSPSRRNSDYLIKELSKINLVTDKYDLIRKLFEANKSFDFVPTPKEFLKDFLDYAKDEENNILEPTCGLGHVIHEILKVNPKAKIIAYEFNKDFYDILLFLYPKNMYPNITFYNKDFLKYAKNENFGLVFCNPPFTINNDKKYFYNFLIKCQELISQSKVNKFEILLFFISPPLYDSLKNAGDTVDWSKFISSISKNKIEDILDKKISNNEYKYIKDYYKDDDDTKDRDVATFLLEEIEPGQMTVLDNVKFKVGASISALSYVSINVVNKKAEY